MDRISIDSPLFLSIDAYNQYIKTRKVMENERYRKPDESIFDALLSSEADFTKGENANDILNALNRAGSLLQTI